jgi:serine/threonine-protein kinase RsbT
MSVLADEHVLAAVELTVPISSEGDVLRVRSVLRAEAGQAGFGLTATTKLVTAGSELARNIIKYATNSSGTASIRALSGQARKGVRATFCDSGPGIADLDEAMGDGFSTSGSLGLGLPGTRRLVDEFRIESAPGRGTTVVIEQWIR